MSATPCPKCGLIPTPDYDGWNGYVVVCNNCFDADMVGDPAEYVSRSPTGSGGTEAEAIENWNETMEGMT